MKTRYVLTLLAIGVLLAGVGWMRVVYRSAGADMTVAAEEFLAALSPEQRQTATEDFDAELRTDWHFIPKDDRKGLQIRDMSEPQRQAAHKLLSAALSQVGYAKATEIMSLEEILRELEGPSARFRRDPQRYYFTIFGRPQAEGHWGLSVEGHHLSLNFVVENGRVAHHTPAFFGANPAIVKTDLDVGPKKGTRTLADEELLAFELLESLTPEQRSVAVIAEKAPHDIRAGGEAQPPLTDPEGLPAERLGANQLKTLRALLNSYTEKMPAEVAAETWSDIEAAGFEKVHFAWAGADRPGVGHYYRVQGPTFLVEFCNTQPDSQGNPANHIHSVWRDMRGDFGIKLQDHLHDDDHDRD